MVIMLPCLFCLGGWAHSAWGLCLTGAPTQKPPPGTPFADGGAIVIQGPTGMGQLELAEHIVTHAAVKFQAHTSIQAVNNKHQMIAEKSKSYFGPISVSGFICIFIKFDILG